MTFYVEIAQGSPRNRGLLVPKDDLHKYINAKDNYNLVNLINLDNTNYLVFII